MPLYVGIILIILSLVIGAVVAGLLMFNQGKNKVENKYVELGKTADSIIDTAKKEGAAKQKEMLQEAKAEIASLKQAHDNEVR